MQETHTAQATHMNDVLQQQPVQPGPHHMFDMQ